jgi:hypothetical protein
MVVASLFGVIPTAAGSEVDWIAPTLAALEDHLVRHPRAEAADAYKLLHQSVMGPGHAIPDPAAARMWLSSEIDGLEPEVVSEPLCEAIGGDPPMARIHLRPFVASGGDPESLLAAFVATAEVVVPDTRRLEAAIAAATMRLESVDRRDLAAGLRELQAEARPAGYPAVHHAEAFRAAYGPAYRVVLRTMAEEAGWCEEMTRE